MELPALEGIVVLNINSWSAGCTVWNDTAEGTLTQSKWEENQNHFYYNTVSCRLLIMESYNCLYYIIYTFAVWGMWFSSSWLVYCLDWMMVYWRLLGSIHLSTLEQFKFKWTNHFALDRLSVLRYVIYNPCILHYIYLSAWEMQCCGPPK